MHITNQSLWLSRRAFLAAASQLSLNEKPNPIEDFTTYNNFYEFGVNKKAPAEKAQGFRTDPWTLRIDGEVEKPLTLDLAGIRKFAPVEERVYRFRCVEGWSAIVPWSGIPLARFLDKVKPKSTARFVAFETYFDTVQMPEAGTSRLTFPYREGLRLDEALNPLTLLATGIYGRHLPPQNGAPVRLVVPWKYGFKSAKSLVSIRLVREQPTTSWNLQKPNEYGFYSNVNPAVPHPRWSQATERRLGQILRQPTLPFNGYEKEVGHLYRGLDLVKNF